MITLLVSRDFYGSALVVNLDITSQDVEESDSDAREFMAAAKKQGRKSGSIWRRHVGITYFSYVADQQAELEVRLVPTLVAPRDEFHVQANEGSQAWARY
ncbi:MAG TPA: hypothetical protein PLK10_06845 [Ottowia sp.]|nr:hypothetical protein [Ottowia sp.]